MFLYYSNEESDDAIHCRWFLVNSTILNKEINISRNIKAVFFKLGARNVHHKRNKMTPVVPLP